MIANDLKDFLRKYPEHGGKKLKCEYPDLGSDEGKVVQGTVRGLKFSDTEIILVVRKERRNGSHRKRTAVT